MIVYVMGEDVVEQEGDIERTDLFAKSEVGTGKVEWGRVQVVCSSVFRPLTLPELGAAPGDPGAGRGGAQRSLGAPLSGVLCSTVLTGSLVVRMSPSQDFFP